MTAIYARQSVDKKDSLSIEGQLTLCRVHAGTDVKEYIDRGYSGKNTKRPAFTELMHDVAAGEVQKILVYRLDRLSRSISDFSRLWETLETHGVAFQSVTENFDTSSPIGRAMLNIVLVFAQLERETTAERVRDNYIHRFQLGAWPGGPAPFGYDLCRIADGGRTVSSLRPNARADLIHRIFSDYALQEISLRGLAKKLTEEKIHGPRRSTWDSVTLSRILHSPLYVRASPDVLYYYASRGIKCDQPAEAFDGVHACNVVGRRKRGDSSGTPAPRLNVSNHEGFIDAALWLTVQEKLDRAGQLPRGRAGQYSWLTGLMKCGCCGYALKVNYRSEEQRYYLLCSGRSNLSVCTAAIHIDLRELEAAVESEITRMLLCCPAEAAPLYSSGSSERLLEIERKVERLVRALSVCDDASSVDILSEIKRLHTERAALEASAEKTPANTPLPSFSSLSFAEKKLATAELLDRVELSGEDAVIYWKI